MHYTQTGFKFSRFKGTFHRHNDFNNVQTVYSILNPTPKQNQNMI